MGLAVKQRKKYLSHKKRWDKETILSEAMFVSDYALKNKKEIRKVELLLSKYKKIAKNLNRDENLKNSTEATHFIEKVKGYGFLGPEAQTLDEILDIKVRDILERRLSNIVYKKQLARSPKQARQFVIHRHITVGGKCITSPSHLVSLVDEQAIEFLDRSSLANPEHPERRNEMPLEEELEQNEEAGKNKEKSEEKSFDEVEAELDDEEQDDKKE